MRPGKTGKRLLKIVGVIVAVALILFLLLIGYQTLRPVKLENLSLVSLSGEPIPLDRALADKYTVLNFWATWCKPCIEEMPMLDSVHQSMDKEKWQILLISEESADKIEAFQSRHNFSLFFLRSGTPLSALGITALPKTVIVDEKSHVLYTKTGGLTMGSKGMLDLFARYEKTQ